MDATNQNPAVGPSVFMPQKHPELRQLGSKSIQTFLQQREQYLLKAEDAVEQGSTYKPVSLVNSVDFKLLKALIAFDNFKGVTTVSELTDDVLLGWLKSQVDDSNVIITPEELEALLKKTVHMKMSEADAKIRIMSLFTDYYTFLEERNLQHILTANTKVAVKHICVLLKPAQLRQKIENDLALEKAELKKDWKKFYLHAVENAVSFEEFFASAMQSEKQSKQLHSLNDDKGNSFSRRGVRGRFPRAKYNQPSIGSSIQNQTDSSQMNQSTDPQYRREKSNNFKSGSKEHTPPLCLNQETCPGENHYLRDCGKTQPQKKRLLLAEYRRKKIQKQASIKRVRLSEDLDSGVQPLASNNLNGRIAALLCDSVSVIVSGDYGSDHAALSENHLAKLAENNVFVPVLPLKEPVCMELAVEGTDEKLTISANRKARISTTLSTMEGPLLLRNVEYLVFNEPMKEVLLSRPLLQSLGFNLDQHLLRLRGQMTDVDCSNIGFEPSTEIVAATTEQAGRLSLLLNRETEQEATYLGDTNDKTQTNETSTTPQAGEDDSVLDVGQHLPSEVTVHLDRIYNEALDNGLPLGLAPRFRQLLDKYKDVFRVKLGSNLPVQVPPMHIRLQADAKPVRVKLRRYTVPQEKFLHKKVKELQQLGLVKRNAESSWACAPLILPKPGPEGFRFTTDLRPVNKVTLPHVWPMPNLETVLRKLANKTCFASIDLCHGYWQFPLAEDSQECQSFITPDGVYTPTRVMHGQRNAVAYCQSSVQSICEPLIEKLLFWLDDILLHDDDPSGLLDTIEAFLRLCVQYSLKLHAVKCRLFLTEVRWCGRLINGEGVRMDPARLNALLDMPFPTTGDQLQQFVCAANWMRAGIPQFTTVISPLADLLEDIYGTTGSRTKRRVSKVKLSDKGWDKKHEQAFESVKEALANLVVLSHPDSEKLFCLFTDASDKHWSSVLTQIDPTALNRPFEDQCHQPLAFLSGSFKGSSSRWSTPEKEASAIVYSVQRLDYLLLRPEGFHLFTDHSNLVFMFNPEKTAVRLNKASMSKIQRWGMILAEYQYTIVYISGDDNCWADLLSRWGASPPTEEETKKQEEHLHLAALLAAPIAPEHEPDFTWPSKEDIMDAQNAVTPEEKLEFKLADQDGILRLPSGAIFIPHMDTHLQFRICVIGHCGRGGHRASDSTYSAIRDYCYWKTMQKDIECFCQSCLHCISTTGSQRVPRPLGHAMHAEKPNEIIHFDFLFMGESHTEEKYVLIIEDDLSNYSWLFPSKDTDASTAAASLLKWFSAFGVTPIWISDRGSHFKNNLMDLLNRSLHCHHHFTAPNTPQANGTVERVCREVLRCCRALLSEFRLKETEWPCVLPIIQSVLNHTKRASLGDRAAITVFTGLQADNPLKLLIPPANQKITSLNQLHILQQLNVDEVIHSLGEMHRDVFERKTKQREAAIRRHNDKTNVKPANFEVGDFVLVAKRIAKDGHKLRLQWLGPQRILRVVSDWVYECQDLVNERMSLIHANRLKFYSDSQLNVTQELLDTIDHNDIHYNVALKLLDLRYNRSNKYYEVQVKWKGFDHEDPTWEPIHQLQEDIPDMLDEFLKHFDDQNKATRAQNSLSGIRGREM